MTYSDDMLKDMLERQKRFQHDLGYSFKDMDIGQITAYITEYAKHLRHEIGEMEQELPFFKSWKQYDPEKYDTMMQAARNEWADVVHFFLNVTLALGMSAEDVYASYLRKQHVNHERQTDTIQYKRCIERPEGWGVK